MYRVIGKYAVELLTSGRSEEDEFSEIIEFAEQGDEVIITDDYEYYASEKGIEVELITRDYNW